MSGLALPTGCEGDPAAGEATGAGSSGSTADGSTGSGTTMAASSTVATGTTGSPSGPATATGSDPAADPTDDSTTAASSTDDGSDEGPAPAGWLEIGYGLDAFFAFEDELPLILGPQGFMMFSLPLRGSDFPIPPDPFDFDHPDTPMLSVWLDIDGIPSAHPSGHFAAYLDYPVPFAFSDEEDVDYEFVSVWLVIPETYPPSELAGREAILHADLATSDGQHLVDEHTLTVLDATGEQGGDGGG